MAVTDADQLTEEARAEFRGFFYGEGSILVVGPRKASKGSTATIKLAITQRSDNVAALEWLRTMLGGRVNGPYRTRGSANRGLHHEWYIMHRHAVEALLLLLLEGQMPSTKRAQAVIALQLLRSTRPSTPGKLTRYTEPEKQYRTGLIEKLRALKRMREAESKPWL